MPRMMLSDAEAALIEKVRIKNTQDLCFNQGVEEARQLTRTFLESKIGNPEWSPFELIEDLDKALGSLVRRINLKVPNGD